MDLSGISTEDLKALQAGDLSKVSTEGLKALQGPAAPTVLGNVKSAVLNAPIPGLGGMSPQQAFDGSVGALRGAKDVIDTGAHGLAALYDKVNPPTPTVGGLITGQPQGEAGRIRALDQAGQDQYNAAFGGNADARGGRIFGQGAITAPIGGVLGRLAGPVVEAGGNALARVAPAAGEAVAQWAPKFANALRTNGFSTGAPAAPGMAGATSNLATRSLAGGIAGGAQVGAVDPGSAGTGAIIGAALPGGMQIAEAAGPAMVDGAQSVAARLMESALKPTLKQKQTGEAATAVRTLLDYGINPTKGGVEKLNSLISDLNDQVSSKIAGSSAVISPQKVVNALADTERKFGNQVAPTSDLNAISGVKQDFLNNAGAGDIPVQLAQDLKTGTYATLKGKYGQMGSAETEAQKGLARGLKDEISAAVPEVAPLNAEQSRLMATLNVAERRAMMDVNKNPLGLAALAVHEPTAFIAFMADKSAAFKSMAARAINAASQKAPALNALAGPAAFRALPRSGQQQP